jgi:hypothetical protein
MIVMPEWTYRASITLYTDYKEDTDYTDRTEKSSIRNHQSESHLSAPSVYYYYFPAAANPANAPLLNANCKLYPPHGPTTSSVSPVK